MDSRPLINRLLLVTVDVLKWAYSQPRLAQSLYSQCLHGSAKISTLWKTNLIK